MNSEAEYSWLKVITRSELKKREKMKLKKKKKTKKRQRTRNGLFP